MRKMKIGKKKHEKHVLCSLKKKKKPLKIKNKNMENVKMSAKTGEKHLFEIELIFVVDILVVGPSQGGIPPDRDQKHKKKRNKEGSAGKLENKDKKHVERLRFQVQGSMFRV